MSKIENTEISERILKMVKELAHWEDATKTDEGEDSERLLNLNLISDLNLDSIQLLDLLMNIEEEFDVRLDSDDVDLDEMMKVDNLINFVCSESQPQKRPC